MSNKENKHAASSNSGYRASRIVLIYGLFGPPIGGLIVYVYYLIDSFFLSRMPNFVDRHYDFVDAIFSIAAGFIAFPLLGYAFGGVQALLTGLLIKTLAGPEGKFGYLTVLLAATVVGASVGALLVSGYVTAIGFAPITIVIVLGVIGIAASIIVRFLFRRRFGKKTS